jgi:putative transcriptional regulator
MGKFYKDLKAGLDEALAYRKGKIKLHTELIEVPEPPAEYRAKDIQKIRRNKQYSQSFFAKVLNVSVRTVQSWESGKRNPNHAALRLLEIIDKGIYSPSSSKKN